jgi:phage baseplate assembly protein W/nucleoid-associated protein YgaU
LGILQAIAEELRATQAGPLLGPIGVPALSGGDDRYWKTWSYAFQLHLPASLAPTGSVLFPLVLAPTAIQKTHPFSAELTPTQDGGVVAEENGVIISQLTIQGHTGLSPRLNVAESGLPIPLSGQAHFLYLQNVCFLRYSDLKKDPTVAKDVYLTYHNYKDGEHYIVVPREFRLERSTQKNFFYNYTITLAVVGYVENPPKIQSNDSAVLRAIADAAKSIGGAAQQLIQWQSEISGIQAQVGAVVGLLTELNTATTGILGAVSEFTRSVRGFINLPLGNVRAARDLADNVARLLVDNQNLLGPAYLEIAAMTRSVSDAYNTLLAYPEKFREDFDENATRFLRLVMGPADLTPDALEVAASSTITQPEQLLLTGPRPGDQARVNSGLFDVKRTFPKYTGFRQVTVQHGDTIASIAARELEDARRWIDIAIANGIKAPYISEEGLPGTLRYGQPILIPTTAATQPFQQVRSAGDPTLGASQLEALFGRDFELKAQSDGTYDLVLDPTTGTDARTISGLENLEQAIVSILSTEQGSNLLYRNVGYERIVGRKGSVERVIEARARIVSAVQRDSRVRVVSNASLQLTGDTLEVALDVQPFDRTALRVIGRVIS